MTAFPRIPDKTDISGMKKLWQEVFGDSDAEIDAFFDTWYSPEMSLIIGECDSIAFLLDFGTYLDKKCAMIYAVSTAPEKRRLGYASTLCNALSRRARELGFAFTCLHPAEQSLFGYYETHTDQRTCFYAESFDCTEKCGGQPAEKIPPEEYSALREALLGEFPHISMNLKSLRWFAQSGGCFLKIGSAACAAAEMREGELFIRELISPAFPKLRAAGAVYAVCGGERCHVTAPDFTGIGGERHGTADISLPPAFLGLTFE